MFRMEYGTGEAEDAGNEGMKARHVSLTTAQWAFHEKYLQKNEAVCIVWHSARRRSAG